jgi:hypothetical protein
MNRDAYLAAVLLSFSLILYFIIIPLEVPNPKYFVSKTMPPDFFPRCITVVLGILSSVLLIQRVKRIPSEKGNEIDKMDADQKGFLRHAVAAFLFFFYVLSIYWIGWIISTGLALPGLMVYFGARRWFIVILLTVLVPIILYLFFEKIVQVPLPKGMFFR